MAKQKKEELDKNSTTEEEYKMGKDIQAVEQFRDPAVRR